MPNNPLKSLVVGLCLHTHTHIYIWYILGKYLIIDQLSYKTVRVSEKYMSRRGKRNKYSHQIDGGLS